MSLSILLNQCKPLLATKLASEPVSDLPEGVPACVLFFSVCNGQERAHVQISQGQSFEQAWEQGSQTLNSWMAGQDKPALWLRVDLVNRVEAYSWADQQERMSLSKRNYFRFGLSFKADFSIAFLEQELAANAILYDGKLGEATPNAVNLAHYSRLRFGQALDWPQNPEETVWRFKTMAVFSDGQDVHEIEHQGRHSGYRKVLDWGPGRVRHTIDASTQYLAEQVKQTGQYHYGWFPCFDRAIPTYNALRHASSTYALLEGWEVTGLDNQKQAIERALQYLTESLIKVMSLPDGSTAAFLVDTGDEIKLGGNAVCLLALVKYTELTGDQRYLPLLEQLALGIVFMQDPESGSFVHVLNYPDLSLKDEHRIIYYDGEAAFGLMRLYGLTRDARWLSTVEKAFDFFIKAEHWNAHDHWLSYCVNELTLYKPEPRYYQFGLDNVHGYLDFVQNRITTFPTLLELMMAAQRMIVRMQSDANPQIQAMLDGFPLDTFYQALEIRARSLLDGFFWPELAMYFKNPARILNGFFIRHHSFRVRIDDIEHYLSGYVAYLKYLKSQGIGLSIGTPQLAAGPLVDTPEDVGPSIVWGGDVNLGRRQHYRTKELGADKVLQVPPLRDADLSIVNLECVIATQGAQGISKGEGGPYYFRARPEMLEVLLRSGVNAVVTANNHAGDYGGQALLQQAELLDAMAIAHAGSGANRRQAFKPFFAKAGRLTVAVFAIDMTQHRFAAKEAEPGTAYLAPDDPDLIRKTLSPLVKAARKQAHVVLVAVHYGANLADEPAEQDVVAARAVIDAGADAVLGSSAHVLQGIEIYQGRPIIHDAGDLLFDAIRQDFVDSGVFKLEINARGVKRVSFIPVGVGFGQTLCLEGDAAVAAARRYAQLCESQGTAVHCTKDGTVYVDLVLTARGAPRTVDLAATPAPRRAKSLRVPENKEWTVAQVPEDAVIPPVKIGPLRLLGLRVSPSVITHRTSLWVESFWTADEAVGTDFRLDFRAAPVRRTSMSPWGIAMDHDPCDWMMPTSRWQAGKIYRDFYSLRPPYLPKLKNVPLQLEVGLKSAEAAFARVKLPRVVHLAIPGRDEELRPEKGLHTYRTDYPAITRRDEQDKTWTADELAQVTGGIWLVQPPEGWYVKSLVAGEKHIDMLPGPSLFVAHDSFDRQRHEQSSMPARNFDRHRVLARVCGKVVGAIVSKPVQGLPADFPVLYVADPIKSLIELGLAARQRYTGPLIAVTGTVGKSTTSDMLKGILQGHGGKILASIDNYNSRVGAPALLASLAQDYSAAIVEVAQSALWMKRGPVTRLLKPTVAILTEVGLSQTNANIRSLKDVAHWKSRVFDSLQDSGVAVIGEHLPHFEYILEQARNFASQVIVYGESSTCGLQLELVSEDESGSLIKFTYGTDTAVIRVPVPGVGGRHNAAAAIAAALATGYHLEDCREGVEAYQLPHARLQRICASLGDRTFDLIDDSYNAEVLSMINAFSVVGAMEVTGRKIAVLGRIVHLGDMAEQLHAGLAEPVMQTGFSLVVTQGEEMLALRNKLPASLLGPHCQNAAEVLEFLHQEIRTGDLVLLKGSRRDSDFGTIGEILGKSDLPANQQIIQKVVAQGENLFQDSPFLGWKGDIVRTVVSHYAVKKACTVRSERGLVFSVTLPDGGRTEYFSQNNPAGSMFAFALTADKSLTKRFLQYYGFPCPQGAEFTDKEKAFNYLQQRGIPQVVKPVQGSGGKGISTNIEGRQAFDRAWSLATERGARRVVVEDFVQGDEVRIITVGGQYAAALCRVPAFVVGDGSSTVQELIDTKNQHRMLNPLLGIHPIRNFDYFLAQGRELSDVPAAGEHVRLSSVSNLGMGGDSVNLTEQIDKRIIRCIEQAAAAIPGATLLGFDVLIKDFKGDGKPGNIAILEINYNCGTTSPYFNVYGKAVNIPLKLLEFIERGEYMTANRQTGPVQIEPAPLFDENLANELAGQRDQVSLLRRSALALGLKLDAISETLTVVSSESQRLGFQKGLCSLSRSLARRASNDRDWTLRALKRAALPVPAGRLFKPEQVSEAWKYVCSKKTEMLVQPNLKRGNLLSYAVNKSDGKAFEQEWDKLSRKLRPMYCEAQVSGSEFHFFVVGNSIVAALAQPQDDAKAYVDCTEQVHGSWARVASQLRQAMYGPVHLGFSIRAQSVRKSADEQEWHVVDVTTDPLFARFCFSQGGRDVVHALLTHAFSLELVDA
ncbi:CapA family protein [Alcaligenes sp. AB3]|uniref:CapA family protein n=1 Tax=Alcaligenes sp. AB3 TaxID=2962569 RepID=UPI0028823A02|nr:CapA family protein [Alcaligenes sp. AB3]MDT0217210.1 CapA family protein [Alcaligenes sp. AB3]